jgi:hypothetical protein
MRAPGTATKGTEKILCALGKFDYLTAAQVTRLCYAKGSHLCQSNAQIFG